MEDYQEQEYEFLRRLEDERIGRRTLVKRGITAGVGLTVLSFSPSALAARKQVLATPPTRGTLANLKEMVQEAKKEGHLNTIALPPDWANYGEVMSTFSKKYGIAITNDNPDGSSAEENQAVVSLKGDPRAPDVLDVNPTFAVAGTSRACTRSTTPGTTHDPAGDQGHARPVDGRLLGFGHHRVQQESRQEPAEVVRRSTEAGVQEPGRSERSPLTSGSAIAGVFAAALSNGGSLSNVAPGVDWFAKCKSAGNSIPVQTVPQTVARPDADLDRLGLQQQYVE